MGRHGRWTGPLHYQQAIEQALVDLIDSVSSSDLIQLIQAYARQRHLILINERIFYVWNGIRWVGSNAQPAGDIYFYGTWVAETEKLYCSMSSRHTSGLVQNIYDARTASWRHRVECDDPSWRQIPWYEVLHDRVNHHSRLLTRQTETAAQWQMPKDCQRLRSRAPSLTNRYCYVVQSYDCDVDGVRQTRMHAVKYDSQSNSHVTSVLPHAPVYWCGTDDGYLFVLTSMQCLAVWMPADAKTSVGVFCREWRLLSLPTGLQPALYGGDYCMSAIDDSAFVIIRSCAHPMERSVWQYSCTEDQWHLVISEGVPPAQGTCHLYVL